MKTLVLSVWTLIPALAFAQNSTHTNSPTFLYGLLSYDFPKSYGFTIGTSIPFHSTIKEGTDRNLKTITTQKDEMISFEAGGYRNPFTYTAIVVKAGIGIRYDKSPKRFNEIYFNQGIFRTIYDGKVYRVDENGNIKELPSFGRTYLTSGFSYSFHWRLDEHNSNPWFVQLKPAIFIIYPYNSFLKLHFSAQAGVSYHLKNLAVRTRTKQRSVS